MTGEEAKKLAYKRLSLRAHHSTELVTYLADKGASHEVIAFVTDELIRLGYLNDKEWVEGTVRALSARKYGPRAIAQKLYAKGIPAEEYMTQVERIVSGQTDNIKALLQTRYKGKNLSDFKERQKVIASLIRKGYTYDEVAAAVVEARGGEDRRLGVAASDGLF